MKILYLVIFVVMHDGTHDVTAMPVSSCPPQEMTEAHYNYHQSLGAFRQWAAVCTTIHFSKPQKKI